MDELDKERELFARAHIEPALIAYGVAKGYTLKFAATVAEQFYFDNRNEPMQEPVDLIEAFDRTLLAAATRVGYSV